MTKFVHRSEAQTRIVARDVTPEMVKAGADVMEAFNPDYDLESDFVVGIWGAMEAARPAGNFLVNVAIWNVRLDDANLDALHRGIPPNLVRPDALVEYWPTIDGQHRFYAPVS